MEIKKIVIEVIPHKAQRYDTLGDWIVKNNELLIRVSDVDNFFYSLIIALHEVLEAVLCIRDGIKQEEVDMFDIMYEKTRGNGVAPCGCKHKDEPGDDSHAPYRIQHKKATELEKKLCRLLGIKWQIYNRYLNNF